jgi:hypothetical protein
MKVCAVLLSTKKVVGCLQGLFFNQWGVIMFYATLIVMFSLKCNFSWLYPFLVMGIEYGPISVGLFVRWGQVNYKGLPMLRFAWGADLSYWRWHNLQHFGCEIIGGLFLRHHPSFMGIWPVSGHVLLLKFTSLVTILIPHYIIKKSLAFSPAQKLGSTENGLYSDFMIYYGNAHHVMRLVSLHLLWTLFGFQHRLDRRLDIFCNSWKKTVWGFSWRHVHFMLGYAPIC